MNALIKGAALAATLMVPTAFAADYVIDTKGAHASINFKVNHLGYSWVVGRFDRFDGQFNYDASKPEATQVTVNIDPASVNSNHAERDKHIRGSDFLDVSQFKSAQFVSQRYEVVDETRGKLHGEFTLRGVTQPMVIEVTKIGEGQDPWGGYRVGFEGQAEIVMKEFGIPMDLGPQSATVQLDLHVEGVKL
ncbi:YceI family protein [Ferrimonas balearica]|uniref:YceI family protein n=1 Tax=Ferrimonas balearica TaxID=44012 RepID=UPI001C99C1C9|nr:YceI family protein [Ferrimonas balearica]MBY5993670.1 YceI family protein [Ferrimonas balearica]